MNHESTKNKTVVVVTGGGRGIGRAICEQFAAAGAQVVAAARSTDELEETKSAIHLGGGHCHIETMDVANPSQVRRLIECVAERFGHISVLVNNAGVAPLATTEVMSEQQFETLLAVNIRAVFETSRLVWPIMKARRDGVIVNLSSIASVDPFPGLGIYGASKAWVNVFTRSLAEEGRSLGIRVFAVAPGAVETHMLRSAFPDFPGDQTLSPGNVAEMVYTLCLPQCRYASGQTIFVRK